MSVNRHNGASNAAGKKILVVDDEPDITTYLQTLLEDNGYLVLKAHSAREAMEIIEKETPDLISLDIMMPKRSGIAFYQDLKINEDTKGIPAIFISAFSMARDFSGMGFKNLVTDSRVPEPEAYFEKPVDIPRLLKVLEEILG